MNQDSSRQIIDATPGESRESRLAEYRLIAKSTRASRKAPWHWAGEENLSVVVAPIDGGFKLGDLGGPRQAAERFLSTTVAPEGSNRTAELISAYERCAAVCAPMPHPRHCKALSRSKSPVCSDAADDCTSVMWAGPADLGCMSSFSLPC